MYIYLFFFEWYLLLLRHRCSKLVIHMPLSIRRLPLDTKMQSFRRIGHSRHVISKSSHHTPNILWPRNSMPAQMKHGKGKLRWLQQQFSISDHSSRRTYYLRSFHISWGSRRNLLFGVPTPRMITHLLAALLMASVQADCPHGYKVGYKDGLSPQWSKCLPVVSRRTQLEKQVPPGCRRAKGFWKSFWMKETRQLSDPHGTPQKRTEILDLRHS